METLLPFLQIRAQMMQDSSSRLNLQNTDHRQRFTSTASSLPSSPTTPLSPSSPFFSWAGSAAMGEPSSPFHMQQQQQSLYLSQLAAINMQLQQRRLLHSTSGESPVAVSAADNISPPREKKQVFTFDHIVVDDHGGSNDDDNSDSSSITDQSEPMDLSRCKPNFTNRTNSIDSVGLNLIKSPRSDLEDSDYKVRLSSEARCHQVPGNLSVSSLESSQVAALSLESPQVGLVNFIMLRSQSYRFLN